MSATNQTSAEQLQKDTNSKTTETEDIKKQFDNKTPNRKPPVIVQLEPTLEQTLALKRAVADELEEKLQTLRGEFDEKLSLVDHMKQELNRRETRLMESILKIEGYMQEIYSLKKVAEDMYQRYEEQINVSGNREQSLLEDCIDVNQKRNTANKLLGKLKPVKAYLEDLAYVQTKDISSAKDLVEYFLVLCLLEADLLSEEERGLEVEDELTLRRQRAVESSRAHPMALLGKEDELQRVEAKEEEVRGRNVEAEQQDLLSEEERGVEVEDELALRRQQTVESSRAHPMALLGKEDELQRVEAREEEVRGRKVEAEQQVDAALSAKVKQDLLWYDIGRWAKKLCKSTRTALPVEREQTEDNTLNYLKEICDFVVMATKISNRLKE